MNTHYLPLFIAVLLLTACKNGQQVAGSPGTPIVWEKLDAGTSSGIETESYELIQDKKTWTSFWAQLTSNRYPEPVVPSVDFEQYTVLACLMGMRPSGSFAISIESLEEKGGELLLKVGHQGPGQGCFVTEALTQPYYLAKIPRTMLALTVQKEVKRVDCE